MGINPTSLGYVYPQQQGSNTTSRVTTGVKAGLFAAGTAGAVTYWGDFKGLTPVDANGKLFEEGLHVLEDKALIQKGIDEASFGAQKTFLQGKGIAVDSAKDYAALSEYVKTGKIAEGATDAQKTLFGNLLKTKREGIYSELKKLVFQDMKGKNYTDRIPEINKILKSHGITEIKDQHEFYKLMNALKKGESTKYNALKEALAKDYKSVIDGANVAGKKEAFKVAAGLGENGAKEASIDIANKYLSSLKRSESYWKSLPETKDGILDFLKKQSGKTGEDLNKIIPKLQDAAEKLVQKRNAVLSEGGIATKIAKQEVLVNGLKTELQTKFGTYFDKARGVLKEGAPKELVQYFKNFKWLKVGKYAAIAGIAAFVGGLLFGGNKA